MTENEFWTRAKNADRELFRVVQDHAGSVSAEHGIGLLKKHAIHFSRSPGELKLLEGIKKVFDPKGLLNPEKVIPDTGN
jgi:FAD/FMN-containing dehydrogenase